MKVNQSKLPRAARARTLMPAERHLPTASGTAARGGSIMEMRPRKHSCSVGKLVSSLSKGKPRGNWAGGRLRWQKPARQRPGIRHREVVHEEGTQLLKGGGLSPYRDTHTHTHTHINTHTQV